MEELAECRIFPSSSLLLFLTRCWLPFRASSESWPWAFDSGKWERAPALRNLEGSWLAGSQLWTWNHHCGLRLGRRPGGFGRVDTPPEAESTSALAFGRPYFMLAASFCLLSPSWLPGWIGLWAWISVRPWGENAPWNYTAPANGLAICFIFRPFLSMQCIKPLWSGVCLSFLVIGYTLEKKGVLI